MLHTLPLTYECACFSSNVWCYTLLGSDSHWRTQGRNQMPPLGFPTFAWLCQGWIFSIFCYGYRSLLCRRLWYRLQDSIRLVFLQFLFFVFLILCRLYICVYRRSLSSRFSSEPTFVRYRCQPTDCLEFDLYRALGLLSWSSL